MLKKYEKLMKYRRLTNDYPKKPVDNTGYVGAPAIKGDMCQKCHFCAQNCPSQAITIDEAGYPNIHIDQCIYCSLCAEICPTHAMYMTESFTDCACTKAELLRKPIIIDKVPAQSSTELAEELKKKIQKTLHRSLQIREIDTGSCNGCDYEANAIMNPLNDLERLGITFVASPRHADMLLVTGPVTRNMERALLQAYEATPDPKIVVALGTCALSGGMFRFGYAAGSGVDTVIPVDMYIPGCPPRPPAIIYGILKAVDRIK